MLWALGVLLVSLWPFGKSTQNEKSSEDLNYTVSLGGNVFGNDSYSEETNQNTSLQYYADTIAQNPIVYSCIREIATSVSSVQYNTVIETRDGEVAEFHGPLHELMTYPNPQQNIVDFIEVMVEQLLVYGNVFMLLERQGSGGPRARVGSLRLLRPDAVSIKLSKDGSIESYQYRPDPNSKGVVIAAGDIGHLKMPNTTTGLKTGSLFGVSPLSVLKDDSQLDALLSDLSMNFAKRGAVPTGLLKISKRITSQEDADNIRARWRSTFSGQRGQFNVAVLDSDSSYEPLQALPKDLALVDTRDEVVSRLCGVLGVPPILIGAGVGLRRSTYSNYKQALLSYRDETIFPLCTRVERFFNQSLSSQFSGGAVVQADFTNAPAWQENETDKVTRTTTLYDSGIISLNEARQELGYDTLQKGDIRRSPANLFEVGINERAPILSGPDEKSLIGFTEKTSLTPSEGSLSNVEIPSSGPVPIPRAQELLVSIRREEQKLVDELAVQLRKKYFVPIKNRMSGIVGRRLQETTTYTKEYPFNENDLVPIEMENELQTVLTAAAISTAASIYLNMSGSGLVPVVEFSERNKFVQMAIQGGAEKAALINRTTRKNVSQVLAFGLENGLTVDEIANGGVLPDGTAFKGLRAVVTDAEKNRVATIARTQIMEATNLSTIAYYDDMGTTHVLAIDGDEFDQECIQRNGNIYTLEAASNESEHPNGTLDWLPVIEQLYTPPDGNSTTPIVDGMVATLSTPTQNKK